jgi:hypothetical protein
MADNENPQPENAPAVAGPNRRARGGAQTSGGPVRATTFSNPENPSDLIAKFKKELGKTIEAVVIKYTASGVAAVIQPHASFRKEGEQATTEISVAEYLLRLKEKKAAAQPTEEQTLDKEYKFVSLYSKRLGKDVPEPRPTSYTEAGIKRWILTQPFEERKILMMNAKEFRKHARSTGREAGEEGEEE